MTISSQLDEDNPDNWLNDPLLPTYDTDNRSTSFIFSRTNATSSFKPDADNEIFQKIHPYNIEHTIVNVYHFIWHLQGMFLSLLIIFVIDVVVAIDTLS